MSKVFSFILVTAIALLFFSSTYCNKPNNAEALQPDTVRTQTPVYDSAIVVPIKPMVIHTVDSYPYAVPANFVVDTAAILAQYFTKYMYQRNMRDSSIDLTFIDTVTQNKITGYYLAYKIIKPCINTETIITKPAPTAKYNFYTGVGSGVGVAQLNAAAMLTMPKHAVSVQTNVIGAQPNVQATFFFKIK